MYPYLVCAYQSQGADHPPRIYDQRMVAAGFSAASFLDKCSGAPQHYAPMTGGVFRAGMPDYLVRNIDEKLAVRIKDYARDRAVTLNDAVLELIAAGLESRAAHVALSGGPRAAAVETEVRMLGGSWNSDEAGAFAEAIRALERLPR